MDDWKFGTVVETRDSRGPIRVLVIGKPVNNFTCDDSCTIGETQSFGIVLTCPISRGGYPTGGTAWIEGLADEWKVLDD